MSKIKDIHKFRGGLNTDDNPGSLPPEDYTFAKNIRALSSDEQLGAGLAETMQAEVELLIGAVANITYYGEAIGGNFQYTGFEEIQIGTQTWMKRNYDVEYPGSKAYDDNELNVPLYGRLYQHGQVMASNFCPLGWRVPTEADIDTLLTYLGGAMIAGGKLKEAGEQDWTTPNTGATDEVGFRALPGGKFDLLFDLLGENCLLWLQDEAEPVAPVAIAATEVDTTSFLSNWEAVIGVDGYYLDVATDAAFTAFVAGFNNKDVGKVLSYSVTGLIAETDYFYRIRAYNEVGYGENSNIISLKSAYPSAIIDADGNVYTYVTIGTQQWMIENFRSTKYADGTPIPNLTLDADWIAEDGTAGHDGAYCWHGNNIANKSAYGALYNWHVISNAHGLAPSGWRVPSQADWITLKAALGGAVGLGNKCKEEGGVHWDILYNGASNNSSGFTSVGAGARAWDGSFQQLTMQNFIWMSDISGDPTKSIIYGFSSELGYDNEDEYTGLFDKIEGLTIRMMRDVV